MKKTYKIDVDCANCANKMEDAAKNTAGVKDATVNFMTLKMSVEFEEGQDATAPSTIPTKAEDDEYTYTFTDWDTVFTNVLRDLDVRPLFEATPKQSETVTFVCGDVNGDGVADGKDASLIMSSTIGGSKAAGGAYEIGQEVTVNK